MTIVSDLACELLRRRPATTDGVRVTSKKLPHLTIHTTTISTAAAARNIGKPVGTYVNLALDDDNANDTTILVTQLTKALRPLIVDRSKILVVGLGNDRFVADSLGPQVLRQLATSPHLLTFEPNVRGVTGINSVDAIKAISDLVHPTAVIVIDSLVSAEPTRIGTNYQICTSGITPGSGLGRDNPCLNAELLGVPVIAIGIPVCTLLKPPHRRTTRTEYATVSQPIYHVVPKDIDLVIDNCATVVASAINTLP